MSIATTVFTITYNPLCHFAPSSLGHLGHRWPGKPSVSLSPSPTMDPFSSPLTAPPTSPQSPSSTIKRGLKRKTSFTNDSSRPAVQQSTPTKRVAVIDLCTPSPAAERVFDLLGLGRRPLAEVSVPNAGIAVGEAVVGEGKGAAEEKEKGSFEGYLALCRMTRQASQRSLPTRRTTRKASGQTSESLENASEDGRAEVKGKDDVKDGSEEQETEEAKERRLQEYRERNVRALVGRSRGAVTAGRLAPGKSTMRSARITRKPTSTPEITSATTSHPAETLSRASTSLVQVDTLPRTRNRYLESFVSHQHEDVMYVDPNPEHAAFRRRDWSPVYACAYSHGMSLSRS